MIRFVQLSQHLSFRQSIAFLQEEVAPTAELLRHSAAFYQLELHRFPEGVQYLAERGVRDPALIEELGIGYARGGTLRAHLQALGYPLEQVLEATTLQRRLVRLAHCAPVPGGHLVEGLFDLAVLWQQGFCNTTCAIGTQFTPLQFAQICDRRDRAVAIAFDHDDNQAGQKAAEHLGRRLHQAGLTVRLSTFRQARTPTVSSRQGPHPTILPFASNTPNLYELACSRL